MCVRKRRGDYRGRPWKVTIFDVFVRPAAADAVCAANDYRVYIYMTIIYKIYNIVIICVQECESSVHMTAGKNRQIINVLWEKSGVAIFTLFDQTNIYLSNRDPVIRWFISNVKRGFFHLNVFILVPILDIINYRGMYNTNMIYIFYNLLSIKDTTGNIPKKKLFFQRVIQL